SGWKNLLSQNACEIFADHRGGHASTPGARIGAQFLEFSGFEGIRIGQLIDGEIFWATFLNYIARGLKKAWQAQQLSQVFGVIPAVEFLLKLGVNVGKHKKNPFSFRDHTYLLLLRCDVWYARVVTSSHGQRGNATASLVTPIRRTSHVARRWQMGHAP